MKSFSLVATFLPMWLLACSGTSTGNPMEKPPGGGSAPPEGAQLLKSELMRESNPQVSATEAATLGSGNRQFAFEVYRELAKEEKNLFFSPYSISVALAMTYAGAEGNTEAEMRETLHFDVPEPALHAAFNATSHALEGRSQELAPDGQGDGFELSIVNQAWGQHGYSFLPSYLDVLATHYGSGLFAVDFGDSEATRSMINGWVEEQTESRVKDLLPPASLTVDTRLVLTNAIYFKGSWLSKFDPALTQEGTFYAAGGDRTASIMQKTLLAQYADGLNYQAVSLPYISPAVRMLLILPAEGALPSVQAGMNESFFQEVVSGLSEYAVDLKLPKFQFESERELSAPLIELGMRDAFKGGIADFSGLSDEEDLAIDKVFHKAFVAVDEQGTEAAAATAVVIVKESAKQSAVLNIDRPFLFAIYDEPTGQILFFGQLLDTD